MADRAHIEEVEAQAALFVLGSLPAEEAARFEQRLAAGCPFCQAEVHGCEQAVAALASSVPQVAPPDAARARLLAQIGAPKAADKRAPGGGLLVRADDTDWNPSPVPGVRTRRLYEQKTLLVRMAPKTSYPAHQHAAAEQCLVLEGSVTSDGVTAYAGDFTYMPAGSQHAPLYSQDGCLLLIAYT